MAAKPRRLEPEPELELEPELRPRDWEPPEPDRLLLPPRRELELLWEDLLAMG